MEDYRDFAYDPSLDLLVWESKPGEGRYGVNIRANGQERRVRTRRVQGIQIRPDSTIWILEEDILHRLGVAALDTTGNFLGWRAKLFHPAGFAMASGMAEADKTVMPLIEKLLARPKELDKKGIK